MDQIRKILAWLKQYHFWVLSVLVAFIGLICWWSAAGALSKQYDDNQKKITAQFNDLKTVSSDPFHPNDDVQTEQKKEISELSSRVKEIWTKLYDAQSENVLKWPSGPGELKPEFITTVDKLGFGAEIPDDLREHYQNYIFRHFPKLPEKIGARPLDESQAGTIGGGGRSFPTRLGSGPSAGGPMAMTADGQMDDNDYICDWAMEDQALVRDELEFPQTPSSLRVWCTQENLWVYHALLDVIRNTNQAANATRNSNAAVRGIYSLEVGQRAAPKSRTPNRILKLATATASPMPGEGGEFPSGEGPAGPGGGGEFPAGGPPMEFRGGLAEGGAEMSEAQERGALLDFRYLGEDGKPVRVAGAGGGGGGPDEVAPDPSIPPPPLDLTAFGKEYKRLPIRMVLEMDQRHLPKLISECAIQPLQIEVQEVRVNVPDAMDGAGGGGGGSIPGMRGGYGEGGGMSTELTGLQAFNPQPQIVTVVIQGVIYIFNKPNDALLNPSGDEAAAGSVAVQ
jgi:hypothetical protein